MHDGRVPKSFPPSAGKEFKAPLKGKQCPGGAYKRPVGTLEDDGGPEFLITFLELGAVFRRACLLQASSLHAPTNALRNHGELSAAVNSSLLIIRARVCGKMFRFFFFRNAALIGLVVR